MGLWDQIHEARKCLQSWFTQSVEDSEFKQCDYTSFRQKDAIDDSGEDQTDEEEKPESFNTKLRSAVATLLTEEEDVKVNEDSDDEATRKELEEIEAQFADIGMKDTKNNSNDEAAVNRPEDDGAPAGGETAVRKSNQTEHFKKDVSSFRGEAGNKNSDDEGKFNRMPEFEDSVVSMERQAETNYEKTVANFWGQTGDSVTSLNMVQGEQVNGGDSGALGTSAASPLLSCTMHNGTKVFVYIADITTLRVGAIVNAANERLQHGAGVALAISNAIGSSFQRDSDKYVKKNGHVGLAGVAVQSTNSRIPAKHVINAVGPIWHKFRNKEECKNNLTGTFLNCLKCANETCSVGSVAVPPISSGK